MAISWIQTASEFPTFLVTSLTWILYSLTRRINPAIKANTPTQPIRNPIREVAEGMGISSP
jgi:hypothetical protein